MIYSLKQNALLGKHLLCFILLALLTLPLHAQENLITGTVVDEESQPLPGVNIVLEGTTKGTVTDYDGKFKLNVPNKNAKLIFSAIGYTKKRISIDGKSYIYITMELDLEQLDEIVVIGYGEQKKKEVTGAVVQVDSETLTKTATSDLASALQGQIAGVNVQASSGDPGAGANIMIRGLSSITGASSPLFVVDGIPYEGDPRLSPNEIASIDVLKDAASASVYGTRGAGGVILITTKSGKDDVMKVSVDSYYGIQKITSGVELLNFEEYMYTYFLQKSHNNGTPFDGTWTPLENNPYAFTLNTSLKDVVQRDNAPIQNHSVSIAGGKDGLKYNITGNYFQQDGSVINSSFDRMSVRANTIYKKKKWTFNTGLGFKTENTEYAPYQVLLEAYKYKPYQPALDPDAETIQSGSDQEGSNEALNMSYLMTRFKRSDNNKSNQFNYNFTANYDVFKGLTFMTRFGGSFTDDTRVTIAPIFLAYDAEGDVITSRNYRSSVKNQSASRNNWAWESSLNYSKRIKGHQFKLLGVFSMENYSYSSFFAQKHDLISNDVTILNGATLDPIVGNQTGYNQDKTNKLIGMLSRFQYNYKSRYLLSVSARRDGSSRFNTESRWGIFPSVSAGWNISEEAFWSEGLKDYVGTFKLRGSYGTTGNQNFLDYSNAATITLERDYVFGREESDILALGAIQTAYANANVKWETTIQTNFGIDLGFFNDKLTVTADVYDTNKEDMLFPVLLPSSTGAGANATVVLNVGNMNNKGMELAANFRHMTANGINFNIGGTYSKNRNVITKMAGANKTVYLNGSEVAIGRNEDKVSVLKEGYEAGAFFLIETDGVIHTEQELNNYLESLPNSTAKVGDLKMVDQNGDGIIDNEDRVYSGSGMPEYELGLNLGADYKGFDLSLQWYAAVGGKVINGNKAAAYKEGTHRDLLYQWSEGNPTSDVPANRGGDHENYRGQTDYWLEDGTFVRLRNVTLGYTIPKKLTEKMGVSKFRVYLGAQNPLTFTKYTGYDPEVGNNGLSTRGIDRGNYPVTASYRAGLQFDF
ncbi:TonB-dependent receptor [Limibacter armeniacum]|uniref:SusC/RagA family TonB-linked outer membrane protein n=1 Tax=Limibacter armeniacum TaxID=466084 RepID=UPI002FE5A05C